MLVLVPVFAVFVVVVDVDVCFVDFLADDAHIVAAALAQGQMPAFQVKHANLVLPTTQAGML